MLKDAMTLDESSWYMTLRGALKPALGPMYAIYETKKSQVYSSFNNFQGFSLGSHQRSSYLYLF